MFFGFNLNGRTIRNLLILVLVVFFLGRLSACGSQKSLDTTSDYGEGAYAQKDEQEEEEKQDEQQEEKHQSISHFEELYNLNKISTAKEEDIRYDGNIDNNLIVDGVEVETLKISELRGYYAKINQKATYNDDEAEIRYLLQPSSADDDWIAIGYINETQWWFYATELGWKVRITEDDPNFVEVSG